MTIDPCHETPRSYCCQYIPGFGNSREDAVTDNAENIYLLTEALYGRYC